VDGILYTVSGQRRQVVAIAAGLWAAQLPPVVDFVMGFVGKEQVALVVAGFGVFLLVLIIMSIISVKIGDWVLDTSIGAVDRTLGGIYGVLRGLVLVTIAFLFYIWLVDIRERSEWVEDARLKPLVLATGDLLVGFMPAEISKVLSEKLDESRNWDPEAAEEAARPGKIERGDKLRLENLIPGGGKR
jgi:membrane protein required for colicin V production